MPVTVYFFEVGPDTPDQIGVSDVNGRIFPVESCRKEGRSPRRSGGFSVICANMRTGRRLHTESRILHKATEKPSSEAVAEGIFYILFHNYILLKFPSDMNSAESKKYFSLRGIKQ